jgi:transcriptional regulator with XRE-family HTH domain
MDNFAERVVRRRKGQGWTRRDLARKADLHEQHLAQVERGTRKRIEADTIIKLARALHVSTDYLLGMDEEPGVPPERRPA